MEYNRLNSDNQVFFFGITCLVLCLGFVLFSLYILPYMIWGLHYDIPAFILNLIARLVDHYHYTPVSSKTMVWLLFFIPGIVTGLISYYVSHYIDSQNGLEPPLEEQEKLDHAMIKKDIKESANLGLKILSLMIGVVLVILFIEYLLKLV